MDTFFHHLTEHSQKIATGISILLIVVMSLSVANAVLFVLETMEPPASIEIVNSATPGPVQKTTYKVSNLELFGKAQEAEALPESIDAPETKLNLELQGIFIADEEKRSTAIVAEKNKVGELYEIGDKVPGNATLAAVYADHVLLRRGTRMEKLLFSDTKFKIVPTETASTTSGKTTSRRSMPANTRSELERIRDRIRNSSPSSSSTNNSPDKPNTRQRLAEYHERLQADPAGTLSELGVSPVSVGESSGYRVGSEAEGAIRQAGLQPGDVVLSVNGKPVGVATSDAALMQQVMASSRVRVEVQRGNRRFFLTVPVPK